MGKSRPKKRTRGAPNRSGRRPRVRHVEILGFGKVTMHGLSGVDLTALVDEAGGPELHLGMSRRERSEHPFTLLLLERQSEPGLTAEQIAALSYGDRERLTEACLKAGPETRRVHSVVAAGTGGG